jgi:hypothetical protein
MHLVKSVNIYCANCNIYINWHVSLLKGQLLETFPGEHRCWLALAVLSGAPVMFCREHGHLILNFPAVDPLRSPPLAR